MNMEGSNRDTQSIPFLLEAVFVQDGQKDCVRGAWVKLSAEYEQWDVFKKFVGKVS